MNQEKIHNSTKDKSAWSAIRKFIPYYKPYKGIFFIDMLCVLIASVAELIFPRIVGTITQDILPLGKFQPILNLGILLIGIKIIEILCKYFIVKEGHIMGAKIERDLRKNLFGHLEMMPHKYYDNTKVGTLMSRLTTDLFDITEFAHHCPEELMMAALKIVGCLAILLIFHIEYWKLTLLLFALLPFMIIFGIKYNGKMRNIFKQSRVQMAEINAQIEDTLGGIRVVKSFANEDIEQHKFDSGNNKFLDIKKKNYSIMGIFQSGMKLSESVIYVVIIIFGGYWRLDAGAFIEYLLYATTLLATIRMIAEYTEQFQRGITAFERYQEIMDTPIELTDKPQAKELKDVEGQIVFNDVSFSYTDDKTEVLNHINLTIEAGKTFAIVGPSGSGKSTIANLIPRFYELNSGTISIDGNNIQDITLKSLRKNIGMVQQDVFLFWGSVAENIAYGKPDATMDEIKYAAKMAGADEFIEKLPDGYNSYVGERGVKLSGGQKQRISIARVFLKNPKILILDEATSSLDNESEMLVQKSLDKLAKNRTAIIIAHRLSTIRNASEIIVLTEDGITEKGTHSELMEKDGLYKKLYELSLKSGNLVENAA